MESRLPTWGEEVETSCESGALANARLLGNRAYYDTSEDDLVNLPAKRQCTKKCKHKPAAATSNQEGPSQQAFCQQFVPMDAYKVHMVGKMKAAMEAEEKDAIFQELMKDLEATLRKLTPYDPKIIKS